MKIRETRERKGRRRRDSRENRKKNLISKKMIQKLQKLLWDKREGGIYTRHKERKNKNEKLIIISNNIIEILWH